jgi:alkanesulfonate monooxygenase SsuD/methylene tetrahydromethanopterin reductase-like flavin-dependent oxidoreductase (luciferase family)
VLEQPHAIVTANVLVAPTDEEAAWLAVAGQLTIYAIRHGRFTPLLPPERAAEHPDLPAAQRMPTNRIVGSPATAVARLAELQDATSANELMIFTSAYSLMDRVRSLALLARAWRGVEAE